MNALAPIVGFAHNPTRVGFVALVPCVTAAFQLLVTAHALLRRSAGEHTVDSLCPGDEYLMKTTHSLYATVVTRLIVSYWDVSVGR